MSIHPDQEQVRIQTGQVQFTICPFCGSLAVFMSESGGWSCIVHGVIGWT